MHSDHMWAHPLSAPSLSLSLMSVPPPTVPPLIPVITFPPTLLFFSQSSPSSLCLSWICGASVLWSPPLLPPPHLLFPPVLVPCLLSASHVPDPSLPRLRVIDWLMCSSSCDGSSKNPFNPITSPHIFLGGQHHQIYQWENNANADGQQCRPFWDNMTWPAPVVAGENSMYTLVSLQTNGAVVTQHTGGEIKNDSHRDKHHCCCLWAARVH